MMKGYRIIAKGYWGETAYKNGEGKVATEATFDNLKDAENKKKQFEHWAEINNIPPYEITITEVEINED